MRPPFRTSPDGILLYDNAKLALGDSDDVTLVWDSAKLVMASAAAASTFNIGAAGKVFNVTHHGTFTVGVNDTGYDVKLFGATTGKYLLWDESEDKLVVVGTGEFSTIQAIASGHLALNTQDSDKNVRINSKTFTADASIVAVQIKPAAGVALTNGIVGLEVEPRINDTFAGTSIHAIYAAPWKRGTGAAGNLSGDFLAIEGKLQSDSGYTGTITGPAAVLRAVNSLHGTITKGPVVIYANQHEGNVAWTALLEGAEALGTHSLTTSTDKTGNAKSGTLKVRFNNTEYHIQLYAAA
jgi:hypothetical protein